MTSVDDIRYARSGSTNLAYLVMGAGEVDLLIMSFVIPIECQLEHAQISQFLGGARVFQPSDSFRSERRGGVGSDLR